MYLNSVLDALAKRRRTFTAEDLYKLNEAIFNLPEVEVINQKTTSRLFMALETINQAYNDGHSQRMDMNFFYDYVALLATMQNQHFFNPKQNKTILSWLYEALGNEVGPPPMPAKGKGKDNSAAALKEISKLEAENEALKKEIEKLRAVSAAVATLKAWKPVVAPEPKAKAKAKAKVKAKAKSKSKEKTEKTEEADGEAE